MPELPELEIYREVLSSELIGKLLEEPIFLKPYLLKSFPKNYRERFPTSISSIERKGKYLLFFCESKLVIGIHLMRSGRIRIRPSESKPIKFIACTIPIGDGRILELAEYGKEKMARMYLVNHPEEIPGYSSLGLDPFDDALTAARLRNLLGNERRFLKQFLTDQSAVSGIGNAYANDILWYAQLSPFSYTTSLTEAESQKLLEAIRSILRQGITEIRKSFKGHDFMKESREFMAIHNKKGQTCPRCGDTVRWVYASKNTTFYCATCQTKGKILKDRRTSKFLK